MWMTNDFVASFPLSLSPHATISLLKRCGWQAVNAWGWRCVFEGLCTQRDSQHLLVYIGRLGKREDGWFEDLDKISAFSSLQLVEPPPSPLEQLCT